LNVFILKIIILFLFLSTFCYSQDVSYYFKNIENKNLSNQLNILQDSIDKETNIDVLLKLAKKFKQIAFNTNDKKIIALSNLNIGNAYRLLSRLDSSYIYLNTALNLAKDEKDTLIQINSRIYIALLNDYSSNNQEVIRQIRESYNLSKNYKNNYINASLHWNLCYIYSNYLNLNDSAVCFGKIALELLENEKYENKYWIDFGKLLTYFYLSQAFKLNNQFDSAEFCIKQSIDYSEKTSYYPLKMNSLKNYGEILYKKSKTDEALKVLKEAYAMGINYSDISYLSDISNLISHIYSNLKKFDSALVYYQLFYKYTDSLKLNDIRTLSAKLELKNQKLEFERTELESKRQILTISIIVVLIIISITLILMQQMRNRRKVELINSKLSILNATKDKFFSIISHDLRTPLNSFNDLIKLMNEYYDEFSKEEIRNHVATLKKSSDNLLLLLENLLLWAKVQSNGIEAIPENINIFDLVQQEIENLKEFADKKKIQIQNEISPEIEVFADKDMLSTVIRNLISNSIKFSNSNGNIQISGFSKNDIQEFVFQDNGIGIKDEDKSKIFKLEAKHSTMGTSNEKGTGLGLCLCKEFIEKNNGSIWFESEVNKGTKFTISLPNNNS
jgi:signal transduction histidine kinase